MTDQDIGLFRPTDDAVDLARKISDQLDGAKITDIIQAIGLIMASTAHQIKTDPNVLSTAVSAYCALSTTMFTDDDHDRLSS